MAMRGAPLEPLQKEMEAKVAKTRAKERKALKEEKVRTRMAKVRVKAMAKVKVTKTGPGPNLPPLPKQALTRKELPVNLNVLQVAHALMVPTVSTTTTLSSLLQPELDSRNGTIKRAKAKVRTEARLRQQSQSQRPKEKLLGVPPWYSLAWLVCLLQRMAVAG